MATRHHRLTLALASAAAVAAVLTGCEGAPMPVPTNSPSSSPTPSPTPTERIPVLRPGGTAAANQQFFDYINHNWNVMHAMSDGRSIVDNLVANGFVKSDMEVTPDTTALDIAVDGIQVAVRIQGKCLIGQFSNTSYTGIIAPMLGSGACLVGQTRPIDW